MNLLKDKKLISIPIYREKKIDSDEYIEGFLNKAFDWIKNEYGDIDDERDAEKSM
ncbi:hypothetical protein HOK00_04200 [bacterium]|jgi:hypothetical protein|nr:hypothetical protein [bacterium]